MEKFWSLKAATPLKSCYQVRSMNTMVDEIRPFHKHAPFVRPETGTMSASMAMFQQPS
jgi:hypothetical protein